MHLSDSDGKSIPEVSWQEVARALEHLRHDAEYFGILERGQDSFMQARHPVAYQREPAFEYIFQLEYKDVPGSAMHLAVTYDFDDVTRIFSEYASYRRSPLATGAFRSSSSASKRL